MIDSWNAAVLNEKNKDNIYNLVDQAETGIWNLVHKPFVDGTTEISGVKFTVNPDDTITANGTATANISYRFKISTSNFRLPPGDYQISGCPEGGSASTYMLRVNQTISGVATTLANDYGSGAHFEITDGSGTVGVFYRIVSGTALSNKKLSVPYLRISKIPTCEETTAGNYFLQATVDSEGAVTYSWEEVAP